MHNSLYGLRMSWPDFAILVSIVLLTFLSLLNAWKARQVWLWQVLLMLTGWSICWFSSRDESLKVKLTLAAWIPMMLAFACGWAGRMPDKLDR
jgi:hypothetical protein